MASPNIRRPRAKADGGLVPAILRYLATQQDVWAWRCNSGTRLLKRGDFVQLAPAGTPDIIGYLRHAVSGQVFPAIPFAIEAKKKGGQLNENQVIWHAKAKRFGVAVCTVESLGEVVRFLRELRNG